MAQAQSTKALDKWKKKKWYTILAPKMFDLREIGSTPAEKPELLKGRTIRVQLREIARNSRKGFAAVILKINNVQGLNANTEIVGIETNQGSVRRIVRRRASKADLVQKVTTKDKKSVRMKTTVVCMKKIERKKETEIRNVLKKQIEEIAKASTFEELMEKIVLGKEEENIYNSLKKIASLKKIDIMSAKLM